jgi:hypothetical protein
MHFAGMGSKAGTMLIKVNKSFIKLLIMHFAGTGSKAGTFNIDLITVNEYYILSTLIKGKIKNAYTVNTMPLKHIF